MRKNILFEGKKPAQAMVEFAIALPILLLLLYGILEAGRLLFVYSTVVTASRQAARYGATTGENGSGIPRYQDCDGIRNSANAVGYLGQFDNITLAYDSGPGSTETPYCAPGVVSDTNLTPTILTGNRTRLVVEVRENFTPLVKLVPFFQRQIVAKSARTILYSVPIVVDQEEEEWFKTPTTLVITSDAPDPSQINQSVNVQVTLTGGNPTGTIDISGADTNCQIPVNGGGTGNCNITFNTPGLKVITAFYNGDADHLASSDTEDHTVIQYSETQTTILSDLPDPTIKDQPFVVAVQVTGGLATPTGNVNIDGGQGVRCTITLANGAGSCTLSYNNSGIKTLTATYNGDPTHLPSTDTEVHEVLDGTPTPSLTPTPTLPPTATPSPTITLTPTPSYTPTITPSPVASCNQTSHGAITRSGNVMSMTITNPYPFTLTMKDLTVTWNDDKGHQTGADKKLKLQNVLVGGISIWTGDIGGRSTYTIPSTARIPPGTITISFAFHQSYDNLDGTERILINLLTPGCENNPIDSGQP